MVTLHQSPTLIIQLIQIPVNGSFAFYLFLFISHRLILISKVQQWLTDIEMLIMRYCSCMADCQSPVCLSTCCEQEHRAKLYSETIVKRFLEQEVTRQSIN